MSSFDLEQSFTWLDWKIIDMILSDPSFDLSKTEEEQQV